MIRLAILAALLAACGDSHHSVKPDAFERPPDVMIDADTGVVPRIEPAACRFMVDPSLGLTEGSSYSCGDLVVEENRATHVGHIRVHFIRIHAAAPSTDATIYLDGGPGGDGQGILDYIAFLGQPFLNALTVDGDFVVLGQRGTTYARPFLNCQSTDCSDYAGVADIPSYNTAYSADDVDDLRATLGLTRWNVYGISYGSRLGLEVIRRHGDHLRSALIEGLVPPNVQWTAAVPASFYSALTALNASCTAAGACGTAYGDLVQKFNTAVSALNGNPVSINVQGSPFMLDGNTFAYLLFEMLYSKRSYEWLPVTISDLATRRTDRVESFLASWLSVDFGGGISNGLYMAVVCGELYNPPDPNAPGDALGSTPQEYIDLFGGDYTGLLSECSVFPKGNLQAQLSMAVTSDVRTLVSSGRIDPITPPPNGALAASTLSSSEVVIHENSGHGATLQSACGQQNLQNFFTDPASTLDTSCAAAITTTYQMPAFIGKTAPPTALELRRELAVAPPPPFIRAHVPHLAAQ